MNDPDKFKAPFIPKERIWQETEKLRAAHPAARPLRVGRGEGGQRPGEVSSCIVPVLELAEFDLGIEPFPKAESEARNFAFCMGACVAIILEATAWL